MLPLLLVMNLGSTLENPKVEWQGELAHALQTHESHAIKMSRWRFTYRMEAGGKIVDGGYFGFGLDKVLGDSPLAFAEARKFQAMKLTSAIAFSLSLTCFLFSGLAPYILGPLTYTGALLPFTYGMLGGAGFFASVGGSLLIFAPMFLSRGVSYKNDQVVGAAVQGTF